MHFLMCVFKTFYIENGKFVCDFVPYRLKSFSIWCTLNLAKNVYSFFEIGNKECLKGRKESGTIPCIIYLSIYLYFYLSIFLFIYISIYHLSIYLSFYLSIYLSFSLSKIHLFIYLPITIYLSMYLYNSLHYW